MENEFIPRNKISEITAKRRWLKIANENGFESEHAMFRELHKKQGLSTPQIIEILGLNCSLSNVRHRIKKLGFKPHLRGGGNHKKKKRVIYSERPCHCGNRIKLETSPPYSVEAPHEPYRCAKCRRKVDGIPYAERTLCRTDDNYIYDPGISIEDLGGFLI